MSCHRYESLHSRRDFLAKTGLGLGTAALAQLLGRDLFAGAAAGSPASVLPPAARIGGLPGLPHFAPKAKRVICLFQSGGPSHLDLPARGSDLDASQWRARQRRLHPVPGHAGTA